jgi:hypothetical protein
MMDTSESPSHARRTRVPGPRGLLRRAWASSRPLTFVGVAMLLTLAATMVGFLLDPRVISGAPAWLKPAKFAVSISIYCFTLLWLLTFVRGRPLLVRLVAWATAGALGMEMVIIAAQVVRGTTSHFNVATPLDSALWDAMAFFVVVVWVANLLTAVLLIVQRMPDPAFAWSLRLGVFVSFVGMSVAFLMTTETPEQARAAEAAGIDAPIQGAHSVGVEDGGPGLPLTGWSTTGGDLRVPHFVGLHGLQAVPLIGFLLTGFGPGWLRQGHRTALVWTTALSYLGLVVLLTWQALRGQPLIAPDAATLGALLALAAVTGTAASAMILHARWTIQEEKTS